MLIQIQHSVVEQDDHFFDAGDFNNTTLCPFSSTVISMSYFLSGYGSTLIR